jgi:excisionase family DNA binding protein
VPSDPRIKLTPPQLARRLGVKPDKILTWIRTGELRAVNLATRRDGRPRWLIDEADIAVFEASRQAQPGRARQRRARPSSVKNYFR